MKKTNLFFILAVCMLVACASFSTKKRMEKFKDTTTAFEHELLRANYMSAEQYLDIPEQEDRQPYAPNPNVKIVNFKTVRNVVTDDGKKVARDVEIQFFYMDRNILKTMYHHQEWRWLDDKRWVLTTDLPVFK